VKRGRSLPNAPEFAHDVTINIYIYVLILIYININILSTRGGQREGREEKALSVGDRTAQGDEGAWLPWAHHYRIAKSQNSQR